MDLQQFYQGKCFDAYEFLGAHPSEDGGWVFRTFAPAAREVSVIGEFNGWQPEKMKKILDGNFWEGYSKDARAGEMYKFHITDVAGKVLDRADPYGFFAQLRPETATILRDLDDYRFEDTDWQKAKEACRDRYWSLGKPLNIYEMHAGSWKKKGPRQEDWYSYDELAEILIPYLRENHYNAVELMPLCEYPSDESWGYQETGYFSPTARYGSPAKLCRLVDELHKAGIAAILDFVPVHFAVNDYALFRYDGTALYEYPAADVGYSEWGSCNFMHSRPEVRSFLNSSAYYWLKEFHFDGLRFDAVSNLIYWQGNPTRGEYIPGIDFMKGMNEGLKARMPAAVLIAEDSTTFPKVTAPVEYGGLGFDYKWDLGWMNDTLDFLKKSPSERRQQPGRLTFSMEYFKREHYLLPLSHDEVVHGKGTIYEKMYGSDYEKLLECRALYLYMFAHPGKKLNFMGNELAADREWDESRSLDWGLLDQPKRREFQAFVRALSEFYLEHPALWERDYWEEGFAWVTHEYEDQSLFFFERVSEKERLLFAFNFSGKTAAAALDIDEGLELNEIFRSCDGMEQEERDMREAIETAEREAAERESAENARSGRAPVGSQTSVSRRKKTILTVPRLSGVCYKVTRTPQKAVQP